MALQIRRGSETDLSTFTPAIGELVFDTTNKKLYIGDGVTVGGIDVSIAGGIGGPLSSTINLNTFSIVGVGDINLDGSITATGSVLGSFEGTLQGDVVGTLIGDAYGNLVGGSVFGSDSSVIIDGITNTVVGDLTGKVLSSITGNVVLDNSLWTPIFYGSVSGSVAGDVIGDLYGNIVGVDSTILVSADLKTLTTGDLLLEENKISSLSDKIEIQKDLLVNGSDGLSGVLTIRNTESQTAAVAEFETYSATGTGGFISFGSSRGTDTNRIKLENNDIAYSIAFVSLSENNNVGTLGFISAIVDGPTTNTVAPGLLDFTVSDDQGNFLSALDIRSSGLVRVKKGLSTNSGQDLGNADTVNLTTVSTYFITAGSETATLAAGVEGQIKTFAAIDVSAGNMVITVTNAAWGGTGTMTFSTNGSGCTLQYINSLWCCIGNNGATFS